MQAAQGPTVLITSTEIFKTRVLPHSRGCQPVTERAVVDPNRADYGSTKCADGGVHAADSPMLDSAFIPESH